MYEKIIEHLELVGVIYDEEFEENKNLPFEEFKKFKKKIANIVFKNNISNKKYRVPDVYFESYAIPLFFNNKEFKLVIMHGQGIAWNLYTISEWEKWLKRNHELYIERDKNESR